MVKQTNRCVFIMLTVRKHKRVAIRSIKLWEPCLLRKHARHISYYSYSRLMNVPMQNKPDKINKWDGESKEEISNCQVQSSFSHGSFRDSDLENEL